MDEGFQGVFHPSKTNEKAMIVLSGSDGGIRWANEIASVFSIHGISSLAVAYWKTKYTPKTLALIPIEIIQSALLWLKKSGYSKVGIYGYSKGAELALISGSLIPQIEFVIAISPSCCVFEGIARPGCSNTSSWTWGGQPLPYASFHNISVNMIKNIIKNHELGFVEQYTDVLATNKNEENTIRVENINGPILLLSAKEDAQWPSTEMGKMICDRLGNKGFLFPFHHEIFYPASHILCPVKTKMRLLYRMERQHKKECEVSREQALKMSLDWLSKL
ncbi:MAG TPA: acyl-CoA thioester hydrolase/BAAT C-terminal domain-containing protein [Clostridia bacterium]|nr:acyl-CoA thioester hydrolase/BAAT C-terminal domain-containing protein [Clostridia bacterium]